jgi:hypothetical protein
MPGVGVRSARPGLALRPDLGQRHAKHICGRRAVRLPLDVTRHRRMRQCPCDAPLSARRRGVRGERCAAAMVRCPGVLALVPRPGALDGVVGCSGCSVSLSCRLSLLSDRDLIARLFSGGARRLAPLFRGVSISSACPAVDSARAARPSSAWSPDADGSSCP